MPIDVYICPHIIHCVLTRIQATMLHTIKIYTIFLLLIVLGSSCANDFLKKKQILYLQGKETTYKKYELEEYLIQPRDQLAINLSSLDIKMTNYFNRENSSGLRVNQSDPASLYRSSYAVSDSGTIDLPIVGTLKVAGNTVESIEKMIAEKMSVYLKDFSVSVKLTNFRVTVLGEVGNPGTYYFYEKKVTLLQAISMAGGMNDYSNVSKVRILREYEDKAETFVLDMKSPDVVSQQQFLLRQGDVVYVEPLKSKVFRNNSATLSLIVSVISVISSTITTIILINK